MKLKNGEQKRGDKFNESLLVDLILVIVSAAITVILYLKNVGGVLEDLLAGAVIFTIGSVYQLRLSARENGRTLTAIEGYVPELQGQSSRLDSKMRELTILLKEIGAGHRIDDLEQFLKKQKPVIQNIGRVALRACLTTINPLPDGQGFSAKGQDIALASYSALWKELAAEQIASCNRGEDPLVARVTHSTVNNIWELPALINALNHQEIFIDHGGKVVRVFIDDPEDPSSEIRGVMQTMQGKGIDVYYIKRSEVHALPHDFLWAGDYKAEWWPATNHMTLQEGRFLAIDSALRETMSEQWREVGELVLRRSKARGTKIPPDVRWILGTTFDSKPDNDTYEI